MTTYLGYDVLDQTEHNRISARSDQYRKRAELVDPRTGLREADDANGFPVVARPFIWFSADRTSINTMRDFFKARKGRLIPFWMPTFQADLVLADEILTGAGTLKINWIGYKQYVLAVPGVRRHIQLQAPGLTTIRRVINDATDNFDGTESLALTSTITPGYPQTTLISYLALCRLESDQVEWTWLSKTLAQATFSVVDLGQEYP